MIIILKASANCIYYVVLGGDPIDNGSSKPPDKPFRSVDANKEKNVSNISLRAH